MRVVALIPFLAIACVHAPRAAPAALAKPGWLGEACAATAALPDPSVPPELQQAYLASDPKIAVLPIDRPPDAPANVAVLAVAIDESAPAAPERRVHMTVHTGKRLYVPCPGGTCRDPDPVSPAKRRGPFAGVLAPFALMGGLLWDLSVGGILAGAQWLSGQTVTLLATPKVVGWLLETSGSPGVIEFTYVGADEACSVEHPCLVRWAARGSEDSDGDPRVQLDWTWQHAGCELTATWDLPLESGDDLPSRLDATFRANTPLSAEPVTRWSTSVR